MKPASETCALCAEDGGTLIWQNPALRVVSVEDPDLPGYTRVVWRAHVPEMSDLDPREREDLMQAVFLVENIQRRVLRPHKINLASLGNMTPHLHWHVIPRWRGDPWFPDAVWAPRRERGAANPNDWQERRGALAALREEYTAALRAGLEQQFMTESIEPTSSNQLREPPGRQLAHLHPGWRAALDTAPAREALARLDQFLAQRLEEGATIYPTRVFRALEELAPEDVRVVILGQDPYHGPGQAQGLAFSVPDTCPAPPSLRNIFTELEREHPGQPPRRHNDLSDWSRQGVLLLNTSLTVEQGAAGSHARKGWEAVTDALIDAVARSPQPKVFLLWGSHAQSKQAALEASGQACKILRANHPSPLSALRPPRPFIGCGHFIQANTWLAAKGQEPINWV